MPATNTPDKSLAEAITSFVDSLHRKFPGVKIKSIPAYEDEDFTFEITIPRGYPIDQVEKESHLACIKAEDEYDIFILPNVIYES
jgi:hypothetical protein